VEQEGGEDIAEVISRQPIDDDVEGKRDAEVLTSLESSIKDLRRLERHIFPKKDQGGGEGAETTESASKEEPGEEQTSGAEAQGSSSDDQESDAENAPGPDDRPFE
jgi:hypothetical protein